MKIEINYGSWSPKCKIHIIDNATKKRICDGREPVNNWGNAGGLENVDCKRCLKKIKEIFKKEKVYYWLSCNEAKLSEVRE